MTTRLLPPEEWSRITGDLATVLPLRTAEDCKVLVVETDEGQIVGQWALMGLPHLEGLGIAADHQKGGAVGRRLLQGMRGLLKTQGIPTVLTAAADSQVEGLLEKIGATEVPATFYAWSPEA